MNNELTAHWEYERVHRIAAGQRYERDTLLIRGDGPFPPRLSVCGVYHATKQSNGAILHQWSKLEHVDFPGFMEDFWECAVYDDSLYDLPVWSVYLIGAKVKVDVPQKQKIRKPDLKFENKENDWSFFLPESQEWIRQTIDAQGVLNEERGVSQGWFHVKHDPRFLYDAFIATEDGFEDKYVIKDKDLNQ